MKTFALMLTAGAGYALTAELISQALNNSPLNGDDRFAFFVIGMVLGVFTARKLEWID